MYRESLAVTTIGFSFFLYCFFPQLSVLIVGDNIRKESFRPRPILGERTTHGVYFEIWLTVACEAKLGEFR